jgi:hypothetical protein
VPAGQPVATGAAQERVAARPAVEPVVALAPFQPVVAAQAQERVGAGAAPEHVVRLGAGQRAVARPVLLVFADRPRLIAGLVHRAADVRRGRDLRRRAERERHRGRGRRHRRRPGRQRGGLARALAGDPHHGTAVAEGAPAREAGQRRRVDQRAGHQDRARRRRPAAPRRHGRDPCRRRGLDSVDGRGGALLVGRSRRRRNLPAGRGGIARPQRLDEEEADEGRRQRRRQPLPLALGLRRPASPPPFAGPGEALGRVGCDPARAAFVESRRRPNHGAMPSSAARARGGAAVRRATVGPDTVGRRCLLTLRLILP